MKTTRTIPYQLGVLGLALCLSSQSLFALPAGSFPFVIPGNEASVTITNVSSLNPAPIDNTRRLVARNGHFYDQTGRRVRLLGTNVGTGGAFPAKANDDIIAARLQKYGFNIVRINSFDGETGQQKNGIFADSTFTTLDPAQLDLFDAFVAALKRHGIYVHLLLHGTRPFDSANGFPAVSPSLPGKKYVGYFDPQVLVLEKQFAHDLLTHVNPYTNLSYANDPDVAIIEMRNEDSLFDALNATETTNYPFPTYFHNELATFWNTWLLNKYGSTAALVNTWFPPLGSELLTNGNFSTGSLSPWNFGVGDVAVSTAMIDTTTPLPSGVTGAACHVHTSKIGATIWNVQLIQKGLTIGNNQVYTLQFWAKSSASAQMKVEVGQDLSPYTSYDPKLPPTTTITPPWTLHQLTFNTTNQTVPNHGRIVFDLGAQTGDVWIAGVSFQPGTPGSTLGGETLEAKTVALPTEIDPTPEGNDLASFIIETEHTYATTMKNYVQTTLGSQALMYCTQAYFGAFLGALRESSSDLIDNHEYWDPSIFPQGDLEDHAHWTIMNHAMVGAASGWTMSVTGPNRIEGKPYIVSEYNHPAPNDYSAECLPAVASYAAIQDWDGLYLFNYAGGQADYFATLLSDSWVTMNVHPGKMAYMPMAAKLFLGGTSTPTTLGTADVVVPSTSLYQLFSYTPTLQSALQAVDPHIVFQNHMGMILNPTATTISVQQQGTTSANPFHWPAAGGNKAIFTTTFDTSESIVGFVGGQTAHAGNLSFKMPTTWNNFTSVALAAMDAKPIGQSQSLLLTLMGDVENLNMGWNATRTYLSNWGTGPVHIEGTPGTVSLQTSATSATVYALDPTGARQQVVPSTLSQGVLTFDTSPTYQTAWYEFAMNGATSTIPSPVLENFNGTLALNQSFAIDAAPYNGMAVNFLWNFIPTTGIPSVGGQYASALKAANAVSSPAFSLSPVTAGLTIGTYQYNIVAQVGNEFSFPTQGTVSIQSGGLNTQRVYPNPWRSDQDSSVLVTFDQMPINSTVKIFTVSGHLVRMIHAPSGLATWDLKNDNGHTVASGIYLYLVTDGQNNQTRGKLAIIR